MMVSSSPAESWIDLLWIPLGEGGSGFFRFNGRVYERIEALIQRRRPLSLYHTALQVGTPAGLHVVETMWPSPRGDPASRGVVVQGPVFTGPLAGLRLFRYEVRRWLNGILPDAGSAVGGPQRLTSEAGRALHLLGLVPSVPPLIWGRDQSRVGEMWNLNSVVSWLLARSGFEMDEIRPPAGGRAPGWGAGIEVARAGH
jgi:hypothetical protein